MDSVWKDDLPESLGPMTTKELRQSMRRGSFVIPFLVIQILAILATILEFQRGEVEKMSEGVGMLNIALMWESGPFWATVAVVCMLVMPLGGILVMGQELEEGNHELLLLAQLGRWKIVVGKFLTLWGLCVLTFVSLLPFVVVRYVLGEVEWWYEASCSATVVGGSAVMCAGVIAASAFKTIAGRIGILMLYLVSLALGGGGSLAVTGGFTKGCGIIYHITALAVVVCYVATGLALARSRLRLVVLAYEVRPSGMVIAVLVCLPFILLMATLVTVGHAAYLGLIGMAFVAIKLDVSPKAPAWVKPPPVNIPPLPENPVNPRSAGHEPDGGKPVSSSEETAW
jgi:ABC-type transport system involved in multi-copper enzyme maturation permease subunit